MGGFIFAPPGMAWWPELLTMQSGKFDGWHSVSLTPNVSSQKSIEIGGNYAPLFLIWFAHVVEF